MSERHDLELADTAIVDIEIEAEPAALWRAMTTDDGFAAWMGEGSRIDIGPDRGVSTNDPVTGIPKRGRVTDTVPGERVEFTWWPEDDPDDRSEVSIRLEPAPSGSRVIVTERRVLASTATSVADATAAWLWRGAILALVGAAVHC